MRILTFTTLYPDSTRPTHGIFVENRLRHLIANTGIRSRVFAPVPWFPGKGNIWGSYATYAKVPMSEVFHGIEVDHPRYPLIPKIGMSITPLLMAIALRPPLARLLANRYDFDLIDAHYFYPDGVAAAMLGKKLLKPVVITARGTDVNLLSRFRIPRQLIKQASRHAAAIITVSKALKDRLVDIGVNRDKIHVLRNGVDLDLFHPDTDRTLLSTSPSPKEPILLAIGGLHPLKGHALIIQAMKKLPDCRLMIAGSGPLRKELGQLAASLALSDRVTFLGLIPHRDLPKLYNSVDLLVHPSSREGWPNVLLESLACGTPVVATNVGAVAEIITSENVGAIVNRTPTDIANGIMRVLSSRPDHRIIRKHAEQFSWDDTIAGISQLFRSVVSRKQI